MKKVILQNDGGFEVGIVFNSNHKVSLYINEILEIMNGCVYEFDDKEDLEGLIEILEDYRDNFDWSQENVEAE